MKRLLITLGLACGLFWVVVPTAASAQGPHTGPHAYPVTTCSTLSINTEQVRPGETITVTGANFAAGAKVQLVLKASSGTSANFVRPFSAARTYDLTTVTADAHGAFTTQVTLPASVTSGGRYDIVATTGAKISTSCPVDPFQNLDILADSGPTHASNGGGHNGGTAFTGLDILALVAAGLALIVIGVFSVSRGRRPSARR